MTIHICMLWVCVPLFKHDSDLQQLHCPTEYLRAPLGVRAFAPPSSPLTPHLAVAPEGGPHTITQHDGRYSWRCGARRCLFKNSRLTLRYGVHGVRKALSACYFWTNVSVLIYIEPHTVEYIHIDRYTCIHVYMYTCILDYIILDL